MTKSENPGALTFFNPHYNSDTCRSPFPSNLPSSLAAIAMGKEGGRQKLVMGEQLYVQESVRR